METKIKVKKERKDYMLRVRMNDSDLKKLNKISKILEITKSGVVRLFIESKSEQLDILKKFFNLKKS